MERLVEFFLKRPLIPNLIIIAVLVCGLQTVSQMKKEGFPAVSTNTIIITTIYPGASALDVELNVTVLVEEALEEVSGIKEVTSISRESVSTVSVVADDDANDAQFKKLHEDVDNALSRIDDLPDEVEGRPSLKDVTSDDFPKIELAISGPMETLKTFVPYLENQLDKAEGVSKAVVVGLPDDEVHVLVDAKKAKLKYIDLRLVAKSIRERNLQGSGGTLESFLSEKRIVSLNKFKDYRDVLNTNLRMSADGKGVKLEEIATVQLAPEDLNLEVRNNGNPGVSILIKKKASADTLDTVDRVMEVVNKQDLPAGVTITPLNDQSYLTRNRLKLLSTNAIIGFALVVLFLYLMFGAKTAFWTAFGIPFSMLCLFLALPYVDITLNALTLGATVLVLGMLVDDAIVVAEQINQYREKGKSPIEAAKLGVGKVWRPVLAASITTVIAFSPIAKMGGLPGKFVWLVPVVIALALAASLFDSFFLLPAHLSHGKPVRPRDPKFVHNLQSAYARALNFVLRFRYLFLLVFITCLALAGYVAKRYLATDPFPQESAEGFIVQITQPPDVGIGKARETLKSIETLLKTFPKNEVIGFSARLGTHSHSQLTDRGTQNNLATIFVYLTPYSKRHRTAEEMMDELRQKMPTAVDTKENLVTLELIRLGPPVGKPFEVRVSSNEDVLRDQKVGEIKAHLSKLDGIFDVTDDEVAGKTELNLLLDYDELSAAGLTVQDVVTTLRIAFDGQVVTDMSEVDKTIDFRLRLNEEGRADLGFIQSLPLLNRNGQLINLKSFVSLDERDSKAEIKHVDRKRTTVVSGQLNKKLMSPARVQQIVEKEFPSTEKTLISFAGEPVENKKIFGNLGSAAVLAVVGTYIVITLIFNSLLKPFIVMAAVPFGVVGIVITLLLHGMPISMFAMIGLIGLTGIIVNDSIVMVYTIMELTRDTGVTREKVIEGAVSRLRPILLTTVTTISGLLPTAYGIGGADPFISPMCLTLAYGLLFGTAVILFLVPMLFSMTLDCQRFGKLKKTVPVDQPL